MLTPLRPWACAGDRSTAICDAPLSTLSFWTLAATLRTTIDSYLGLVPQYLGLRLSVTLLALLKLCSRYGPEPADVLFSAASALSDLSAPAASVPAPACTALEFRMPSAGFGTMNGTAGLAVCDCSTTVLLSGALTVMPAIRK